jgi:hypothetical protein
MAVAMPVGAMDVGARPGTLPTERKPCLRYDGDGIIRGTLNDVRPGGENVSTVGMRRAVVSLAALISFTIAGALRNLDGAGPYLVSVFIMIGVVLGMAVAASVIRGRR